MKYSFKINHSFQSNYDDQTRENIRNYNKYISLIKKNNFLKFHEFKKDECLKIFKCYNENPIDFKEIVTKIISRVLIINDKKFYKELLKKTTNFTKIKEKKRNFSEKCLTILKENNNISFYEMLLIEVFNQVGLNHKKKV
ncbi:hypothetical protein A0H76_1561 [Hepatospora eriocheir]|uniref:Uncharacterized protein n=1 Tax=Hepatospora eriocheir TaxID=1081669 RepID=A0A1X0Q5Q3_9MICR|nr:hypothetical protein A0H76_1561 [Hepatospora eriocheir]